eukprot:scaffold46210_cov71-Phaeocystis_antarctica.AAC.2
MVDNDPTNGQWPLVLCACVILREKAGWSRKVESLRPCARDPPFTVTSLMRLCLLSRGYNGRRSRNE